jgi:hypothetical protein
MQRFLREGKSSSSAGARGVDAENLDKASSPGKNNLHGRTSSASSEGVDTSSPGPVIPERSNPSTFTSLDRESLSNITTNNSAGGFDHSTTQSLESWQTQLQHLQTLLDTFQSRFDSKLKELRAGIPLSLRNTSIETANPPTPKQRHDRLSHDWTIIQESSQTALLQFRSDLQRLALTTAVAVTAVMANFPHTSAGYTDSSDNDDDDKDGNAAVQPSPSHSSLMGFFEPSSSSSAEASDPDLSRGEQGLGSLYLPSSSPSSSSASASSDSASLGSQPGLSRVSSLSASAFLNRDDGFTPTLDGYALDRAALSDDDAREHFPAAVVDAAATRQEGAVRPRHHTHVHHHRHRRGHRRGGEVIIDWQRFHTENCREHSQFSSCDAYLGWRRGFERAGGGAAAAAAAWV